MKAFSLFQQKAAKIEKPDSIVEFIKSLKSCNKVSFEEETVLIDSSVRGNPTFHIIQQEYDKENKEGFNDIKFLFKFKNFLSLIQSAERSTSEQEIKSEQTIKPLDQALEEKVKRIEKQGSPIKVNCGLINKHLVHVQKNDDSKVSTPLVNTPLVNQQDNQKNRQFGQFFKEINSEEIIPLQKGQTLIRWNKIREDIQPIQLNFLLNFLAQDKKREEEIQSMIIQSVTMKYKELKRSVFEISRYLMVPCTQEFNLYSVISFLKGILKQMFKINDFEVTRIENSCISLFRSLSITIASGDIRDHGKVKKNLSIFEQDRLYILGDQERDLINDCIIGEIYQSVFFMKKVVDGKIMSHNRQRISFLSKILILFETINNQFKQIKYKNLIKQQKYTWLKILEGIQNIIRFNYKNSHREDFRLINSSFITLIFYKYRNSYILQLFSLVEECLKLQQYMLINKFQDSFQDLFENKLYSYDNIDYDRSDQDYPENQNKILHNIGICRTEFKLYTFIDSIQLQRSTYYKNFENVILLQFDVLKSLLLKIYIPREFNYLNQKSNSIQIQLQYVFFNILIMKVIAIVYHKHRHIIRKQLEKLNEWKMSLNYNQVIYFEFNKAGILQFLNQIPSDELSQLYFKNICLNFFKIQRKEQRISIPENLQNIHYSTIFKDNDNIIQNIKDGYIQKQYYIQKCDYSSEDVDSNLQYQVIAEPGVKNKIKTIKLHLKDILVEQQDNDKIQSPIFNHAKQTHNNKIKNKLTYFTASESKNIILHDNDAKNTTVVEFLSQVEQRKVNEEQKALYLKKLSSPSQQIKRNIKCIADVKDQEKATSYLNRLFLVRKITEKSSEESNSKHELWLKPEEFKMDEAISDDLEQFAINIWKYDENTKLKIPWMIMEKRNYFKDLEIPIEEFINFIYKMREKYNKRENPFHNFDHGIMVMQCCYLISCKTDASKYLNKLQEFSLIFSGLCHDVSHRARTNAFEVNTMSKLAIRYHDSSVLEQHHIAHTFKILRSSSANIFKNLTIQKVQQIRKYIINNILATDMSKHFVYLKDFQTDFLDQIHQKDPHQLGIIHFQLNSIYNNIYLKKTEDKEINLLTGTIIHTSDFHHTAQKFEFSQQWSVKVNKEFSQQVNQSLFNTANQQKYFQYNKQYIEEGKQGVQQTTYLKDLDKMHVLAKNESGFIKMIVKPLWETMNKFLNNQLSEAVANLENSIQEWNQIQETAMKEEEENQKQQELNKLKSAIQKTCLNNNLKNLI